MMSNRKNPNKNWYGFRIPLNHYCTIFVVIEVLLFHRTLPLSVETERQFVPSDSSNCDKRDELVYEKKPIPLPNDPPVQTVH